MEMKQLSKELDKIFLDFKNIKENKKDNKVYKEKLEDLSKQLIDVENKLIDKQKNNFFDKENKEYYETMKKVYECSFKQLQKDLQNINNELLNLVINSKQEKEKMYMVQNNTYVQFFQLISNFKKEIAKELNVVELALSQKKN